MPLEDLTGTDKFIAQLINTNPAGTDARNEGDDHIRGIKNVLINQFGAMSAPVVPAGVPGPAAFAGWAAYLLPVGTILDFAGAAVPAAFLACDGSAVSRTTFANLYAALGGALSPWGQGDTVTTFNVPNFRRRVAVGSGGTGTAVLANTVGAVGGAEQQGAATTGSHVLDTTQMPAHVHQQNLVNKADGAPRLARRGSGTTGSAGVDAPEQYSLDTNLGPLYTATEGGGLGHTHTLTLIENIQPSAVVFKIIKT